MRCLDWASWTLHLIYRGVTFIWGNRWQFTGSTVQVCKLLFMRTPSILPFFYWSSAIWGQVFSSLLQELIIETTNCSLLKTGKMSNWNQEYIFVTFRKNLSDLEKNLHFLNVETMLLLNVENYTIFDKPEQECWGCEQTQWRKEPQSLGIKGLL